MTVAACLCGCPTHLHIGAVGCPCGPPDQPPCVTWLDAAVVQPGDSPIYTAVADQLGYDPEAAA